MRAQVMMIGLILFVSVTLGSFCWAQETAPDMNTLLKHGMDYYQSGNYAEAIRTFSDVLKLSVDKNINLRAHLYLGYTYFLQGESDKSRAQLEDAIKLNPQMILDDREFGPEFIKIFESAKRAVTGIAFIESAPKGATIWIDNEEIGLTPLKRELLSGKYRIKILKAGYTAHEGVIDIKNDTINSLLIDLSKKDDWKDFVLSTVIMGALTFLVRSI